LSSDSPTLSIDKLIERSVSEDLPDSFVREDQIERKDRADNRTILL
jgi:hypothetical protein